MKTGWRAFTRAKPNAVIAACRGAGDRCFESTAAVVRERNGAAGTAPACLAQGAVRVAVVSSSSRLMVFVEYAYA
jgi:hypothetical protein